MHFTWRYFRKSSEKITQKSKIYLQMFCFEWSCFNDLLCLIYIRTWTFFCSVFSRIRSDQKDFRETIPENLHSLQCNKTRGRAKCLYESVTFANNQEYSGRWCGCCGNGFSPINREFFLWDEVSRVKSSKHKNVKKNEKLTFLSFFY